MNGRKLLHISRPVVQLVLPVHFKIAVGGCCCIVFVFSRLCARCRVVLKWPITIAGRVLAAGSLTNIVDIHIR